MSDIAASAYDGAVAVTPSDTLNDPGGPFAGLYTGSGGNIKITDPVGNSTVLAGTAAGVVLPIRCVRVWSTGTAATGVVGLIGRP
jgi:hypothetical protein